MSKPNIPCECWACRNGAYCAKELARLNDMHSESVQFDSIGETLEAAYPFGYRSDQSEP